MNRQMRIVKRSVPFILAAVLLVSVLVGVGLVESAPFAQDSSPPFPDPTEALSAASDWLVSNHRNDDGGFTSFSMGANSGPSDIGGTVDALLALAAADSDAAPSVAYLRENAGLAADYADQDGSTAGKLVLALTLAGEDPRQFEDHDFVVSLTGHLSPTGQFGVHTAFNQSLAILGLAAAGEPIQESAVAWLTGLQATEGDLAGSWSDGFGTDGNADSTAMAMMALLAVEDPEVDDALSEAVTFLAATQLATGGWEYGQGFGENANSTALVLQALYLVGEDIFAADGDWGKEGNTPLTALLAWQSESGAFQADFGDGRFNDFFSTVQSIPALAAVAMAEEQLFVPAVSAGDSPEETEDVSDQEAYPEPEPTAEPVQAETEETVDEDSGGLTICPSTLAISFLAGLVFLVPRMRRR